jgi:hypothetical protein
MATFEDVSDHGLARTYSARAARNHCEKSAVKFGFCLFKLWDWYIEEKIKAYSTRGQGLYRNEPIQIQMFSFFNHMQYSNALVY